MEKGGMIWIQPEHAEFSLKLEKSLTNLTSITIVCGRTTASVTSGSQVTVTGSTIPTGMCQTRI